tara:strand:- start:59 stop:484 length:426 start_codon:yes stop_codon:yes gene_type:complete
MTVSISLNYQSSLSHTFDIHVFIKQALQLKHVHEGSLEFTFIDDDYMILLHQTYLQDKSTTDIMTFNLDSLIRPIGDIYICINEAQRNSQAYQTSLDEEIKQLILHGILHLIGYNDLNDFDKMYMLDEQNRLLMLLNSSIS